MIKIKHFYNPSYTANDWSARNPLLKLGQLGVELDVTNKPSKMKIGDGISLWDDLDYIDSATYSHADLVSNQIGDIKIGDSLLGETLEDIILRMVSPFISPAISGVTNDASGTPASTSVIEVGGSVDTSVAVSYVVSNPENLTVTNNIFIDASGIFTNEGVQTHSTGTLTMLLAATLAPIALVDYIIGIYAIYSGGTSATATTRISFRPAQLHGSSPDANLIDINDDTIPQNLPAAIDGRLVTNTYKNTFTYAGTGWSYMLIPDMLNPSNPSFSEVTDPNQVSQYSMIYQGTALINNGTSTYKYHVYRSEFELVFATKLRVS